MTETILIFTDGAVTSHEIALMARAIIFDVTGDAQWA